MAEALPLQPGDPERLGDFPITGRLGVGEQGAVFVGRAASGRSVAVKLLHVRLSSDAETRARFAGAFAGARRVAGFSTAEILAADVEDGRPYVVSDLVDGPSLAELVAAEGPRGPLVVERLAVGLAVALAAAHRAGAVHHDLKPANVLLARSGPRVTDLGVVTALEAVNAASAVRAENDPSFLAPEQLSGQGIGPAADVYAWATTLLFAATGKPPFGDGSPAEIMQGIVYDDPETDALPESVRDVVADALDKSPSERPTAPDLLRRLLDGPVAARTPASLRAEAEALAAGGSHAASASAEAPAPAPAPGSGSAAPSLPGSSLSSGSSVSGPVAVDPVSPSTSAPGGVPASASGSWTRTPSAPPAADEDGPSTMLDLPKPPPGFGAPPSPASGSVPDGGPSTSLDLHSASGASGPPAKDDGGPSTVLDLRLGSSGPVGASGSFGPPVPSSPRPAGGWQDSRATARDLPVTGPSALPSGPPAPGAFGGPGGPGGSGGPGGPGGASADSLIPGMRPVEAEAKGPETAVLSLPGLRAARPQLKKPQLKKPGNHAVGVAISLAVGVLVGVAIISLVLWPHLRGNGGKEQSKPSTSADGQPVTTIPDAFAGTWKGTAVNPQRGESFPLQVTLQAGAKSGTAVYPKEGCTGTLALTKGTGAELQLALSVSKPCTSGDVRISRQPDGSLKYDWSKPGTALAYRGSLTKG
ncbi:protein kinase [Spirillospora sp. NPDC049652]